MLLNGSSPGVLQPAIAMWDWLKLNNRVPLYYLFKTIFLLALAWPQSGASTYLYRAYVEAFFREHEASIDSGVAKLKQKVYTYVNEKFRLLWEQVVNSVSNQTTTQNPQTPSGPAGAPPSMTNPVSTPVHMITNLWSAYGPMLVASGTALLRQTQQSAASDPALVSPVSTPPRNSRTKSTQAINERRRQLEAELAALSDDNDASSVLIPSNEGSRSRPSSDYDLRGRASSRVGYDEIQVPSDVEGYEAGDGFPNRPAATSGVGSWFGWGPSPQTNGYEKLKGE